MLMPLMKKPVMKSCAVACSLFAISCKPDTVGESHAPLTKPVSGNAASGIASYCISKTGRRVGNGECWTLADEALKSAGRPRPGADMRVWGRVVNPAKEPLKPGDVIEFRSAGFSDGTLTGPAHTAVVVKGGSREHFSIAEQNWGRKIVRIRDLNLGTLTTGTVTVYRPG